MFPFDAEVLASSYALYNAAVWPAQPVALALALAALWLAAAPHPWSGRIVGAILAAGWAWCGLVFFPQHFAALDFMAPVYAGAFLLQAALLLFSLVWRRRGLRAPGDAAGLGGLALAALALFALPLISGLGGAGFAAARIVGLAPGPTVLFTLALLLLFEGRPPWLLLPIPLLWCGVAAVTGWALSVPESLAVPVLALPSLALFAWRARAAK
jgi:hypothetical protein